MYVFLELIYKKQTGLSKLTRLTTTSKELNIDIRKYTSVYISVKAYTPKDTNIMYYGYLSGFFLFRYPHPYIS